MAENVESPLRSEPALDALGNFNVRYADFFDQVAVNQNEFIERIDAIELRLDLVEARVTYLEGLTVVTAIDHTVVNTVTGIQTIICTAALTVDLILAPNDRDKVIVVSQGFQIVIDGNGKTVNGDATVTLRAGFEIGLQMEYSSALDAWFEI